MCRLFHGDIYVSISACLCSSKQHSFVSLHHVKVIWRCGGRLSAARMTSFPGLLSPVTSKGFLLKSSISPCQSPAQPHPKTSADSSIRALPIACLTACCRCSCNPQKRAPLPFLHVLFPFCPLLFLLPPKGFECLC